MSPIATFGDLASIAETIATSIDEHRVTVAERDRKCDAAV
jgi:hypothetical protein